jgi:hypothetical protein
MKYDRVVWEAEQMRFVAIVDKKVDEDKGLVVQRGLGGFVFIPRHGAL